jgi:hypothetical protein
MGLLHRRMGFRDGRMGLSNRLGIVDRALFDAIIVSVYIHSVDLDDTGFTGDNLDDSELFQRLDPVEVVQLVKRNMDTDNFVSGNFTSHFIHDLVQQHVDADYIHHIDLASDFFVQQLFQHLDAFYQHLPIYVPRDFLGDNLVVLLQRSFI